MTPEQFHELAEAGYNRIPVYREVLADLDTPLSTYLKLASGPYSYLFESVQGGEKWGRYSIIGLPSREVLKVFDHRIEVSRHGEVVEQAEVDDPWFSWTTTSNGSTPRTCRNCPVSMVAWWVTSVMTPCAISRNACATAARPTESAPRTSC